MEKISIVVPCYNEEESINKFYDAIIPVFEKLDVERELIFVNDGSKDKTLEILTGLAEKDKTVKVISFSRNFGQQSAILCGYRHASGDAVIELDADLQDPVEIIPEMIDKWRSGYDVVHGRRIKRNGESFFKKLTASVYYKFLDKISNYPIPRDTGDFKLYDKKVIEKIISMPEHDKYIRGLASWVGFKQTFVDVERKDRVAGETKYSLKKMLKLAKTGILSNSDYPLYLSLKFGVTLSVLSVICFITFVVLAILKITLPVVCWLFPTTTLLFGLNYTFNAITNLYISKINTEVQNRPEYIIDKKINL